MAEWAKIKFFYDSVPGRAGSLLTATSQASGYSVENIFSMLEVNKWLMSSGVADPHYISVDLQTHLGYPSRSADYVAILGHNLHTAGATIVLQYSDDGSTYSDAFTPFAPSGNSVILKEFTDPGSHRYWRMKITGHTAQVFMAICVWGKTTVLDYASASFDPHEQQVKANVNLSYGGYLAGTHTQYTERAMTLRFEDADESLYTLVKDWWETSGMGNFFVGWETANSPSDVFLMRPDSKFSNPIKQGSLRDITINLKGRKE